MERLICVSDLMNTLIRNNTSPEQLVGCAIRNLYSLDSQFLQENKILHANSIRSTIAYVKLLYDFGQQMNLTRVYLLHKINLREVCVQDLNAEISVLRGISPLLGDTSAKSILNKDRVEDQEQQSDPEMEILLDTRMISEIDQTKAALYNISQRNKKDALLKIEKEMDDVSNSLLSSINQHGETSSYVQMEHTDAFSSNGSERTSKADYPKRPRDGGARITPPNFMKIMDSQKENDTMLLPQEEFGASRGRHGSAPDAAGSLVYGQESSEGTDGVASASAPSEQVATAETNDKVEDFQEYDGPKSTQEEVNPLDVVAYIETTGVMQDSETSKKKMDNKKRKASTSPESEMEGIHEKMTRRPNKARVIVSAESPITLSFDTDDLKRREGSATHKIDEESASHDDTDGEPNLYTSDTRITRASIKLEKVDRADFSQLKALRERMAERKEAATIEYEDGRSSFAEDFIESVLSREKGNRKQSLASSQKSGSEYQVSSERDSCAAESSSCYTSNGKNKKKEEE